MAQINDEQRFSGLSTVERDALAWEAICSWPSLADGDFVFDGLDYSQLTRRFLWDKVARAIQRHSGHRSSPLEIDSQTSSEVSPSHKASRINRFANRLLSRIREGSGHSLHQAKMPDSQRPLLYVPVLSERLDRTVQRLVKTKACRIVANTKRDCSVEAFQPTITPRTDLGVADRVHQGIVAGLDVMGIQLEIDDAELLRKQIVELTAQADKSRQELLLLKPNAILVHGDNHPPFQAYALLARNMRIPIIMLQHGLDCEHYCLDEAYASHIAVWGLERERRYRDLSEWQPEICLTGNPEFDHLRPPEKMNTTGDYWLWVTRPHISRKCYLPSRLPTEGLDIFRTILSSLQAQPDKRLVVKPHPYDYVNLYRDEIQKSGLEGRVTVSSQDVHGLIKGASVVISEDSTAGMEAMFFGKVLVHAHFAKSKPALPFTDCGAALPGFDPDMLLGSLSSSGVISEQRLNSLLRGQRAFIKDFAGHCDGKAGERILDFIEGVLGDK